MCFPSSHNPSSHRHPLPRPPSPSCDAGFHLSTEGKALVFFKQFFFSSNSYLLYPGYISGIFSFSKPVGIRDCLSGTNRQCFFELFESNGMLMLQLHVDHQNFKCHTGKCCENLRWEKKFRRLLSTGQLF